MKDSIAISYKRMAMTVKIALMTKMVGTNLFLQHDVVCYIQDETAIPKGWILQIAKL